MTPQSNDGNTNSNADNASANTGATDGQTNYETLYTNLLAEITTGKYVKHEVYAGLQSKHQEVVESSKKVADDLAALKAAHGALETKTAEFGQNNATMAEQLKTATGKLERHKLVMTQFPGLVQWEAEGLLPAVGLDELPTVLAGIQAKLQGQAAETKAQVIAGSSAINSGSAATAKRTARQVLDEANQSLLKGNAASYDALYAEYLELGKSELNKE